MTIFILLIIYILSFIAHIVLLWIYRRKYFYRVGDIVDKIEFYMWFPILNTIALIALICIFIFYSLYKLLKLDIVWNWLMNIKLK